MKTELLLSKQDKLLLNFINQCDDGLYLGAKFTVGIKYYGFIYRAVYCEERQELEELEKYLLNTGYFRKIEPTRRFDVVFELID